MKIEKSNKEYLTLLNRLKKRILEAQQRAVLAVNREMVLLYWEIGSNILKQQKEQGWGAKVIDILSQDLYKAFPEMKGFSSRNLKYMRKFSQTYSDIEFVQQVAAQIPWFHNCILMDKLKSNKERKWYMHQTIQNGWSRNVLVHQIELNLYKRQVLKHKATNFDRTLPVPQSQLANQTLKDPYIFDFLNIGEEAKERAIECELTKHITKFLLELGAGFAFIGNQYHIEVSGKDYYIDLLFYHLRLRCYIAIDLKTGEFKPEDAGKINFYLSALDDMIRDKDDNPSIGILLCKTKKKLIVEYALKDITKPIGVSQYRLVESVPNELKTDLPTVEQLERELK